jgi:hypothetical protein
MARERNKPPGVSSARDRLKSPSGKTADKAAQAAGNITVDPRSPPLDRSIKEPRQNGIIFAFHVTAGAWQFLDGEPCDDAVRQWPALHGWRGRRMMTPQ